MTLIVQNGNLITKSGRLATDLGCCCSTCSCVACRNGCSFYVSGEGYDSYDARCGAPSAPADGYMSWLPPTSQSSPGVSSGFDDFDGPVFASDYIHVGKASQSVRAPFMPQTFDVARPYVWGHRYRYQGTVSITEYHWFAGFSISCVTSSNNAIVSLIFGSELWDTFATGSNISTKRGFSLVLQTATTNLCKDVSVSPESRYNECPVLEPDGNQTNLCRIEIPFPLSIQINGDGTTLNGTLYPWSTPVLSATPASVSFVVSKRDCCFNCESGSQNICCNPLP